MEVTLKEIGLRTRFLDTDIIGGAMEENMRVDLKKLIYFFLRVLDKQ